MISDRLWRSRFGADPSLVGRAVQLSDRPFTVIGVLPPDFRGLQRGLVNDVWISLDTWSRFYGSPASLERRDARHFEVVARLAPGATLARAASDLALLGSRWATAFPEASRGSDPPRAAGHPDRRTRRPARPAPRRGRASGAGDRRRQCLDPARGPRRRPSRRDGDEAGPRREPVAHRAAGPGGGRAARPGRGRRGPGAGRGPRPRGAGAPPARARWPSTTTSAWTAGRSRSPASSPCWPRSWGVSCPRSGPPASRSRRRCGSRPRRSPHGGSSPCRPPSSRSRWRSRSWR